MDKDHYVFVHLAVTTFTWGDNAACTDWSVTVLSAGDFTTLTVLLSLSSGQINIGYVINDETVTYNRIGQIHTSI